MPGAVLMWWQSRCLLKTSVTQHHSDTQWLAMGNVASSGRHCPPAGPWRLWAKGNDDGLAVDGDYRREHCVTRPAVWRGIESSF